MEEFVATETNGRGRDNGFSVIRSGITPGSFSGITGWHPAFRWVDVPFYDRPTRIIPHTIPQRLNPTKIAALTNPSRPVVDVPVFIAELGDVPKLIRLAGNSLLGKSGSAVLAWKFGWAPLIDDLKKLLDFGSMVSKRTKEIQRLYSQGGLKRRVGGKKDSTINYYGSEVYQTYYNGNAYGTTEWRTEQTEWGTARWRPTVPSIPDGMAHLLAVRSTLGLDLTMSTVWEALPWSWMADWFGNVGDYLMANRNTVPCELVSCCYMRHVYTDHKRFLISTPPGTTTILPYRYSEYKDRVVGGPSLAADMPFLDAGRLSIIGALAAIWADRKFSLRVR
jgi:uncharacterized protein YceK